jgi:hypothetical protein
MTILDEGKLLRNEVAKLRPDKRRRYSDKLRARILEWVERATADGMTEPECSKFLGVKTWRFVLWRRKAVRQATPKPETATPEPRPLAQESEPLALVPIEVTGLAMNAGLTVVAPSGHRVEGLSLAQVAELLRELA